MATTTTRFPGVWDTANTIQLLLPVPPEITLPVQVRLTGKLRDVLVTANIIQVLRPVEEVAEQPEPQRAEVPLAEPPAQLITALSVLTVLPAIARHIHLEQAVLPG